RRTRSPRAAIVSVGVSRQIPVLIGEQPKKYPVYDDLKDDEIEVQIFFIVRLPPLRRTTACRGAHLGCATLKGARDGMEERPSAPSTMAPDRRCCARRCRYGIPSFN